MTAGIYSVERISGVAKGNAYLLSVGQYPLPKSEVDALYKFCDSLVRQFRALNTQLSLEVIIRQSCLYTGLLETFVDNAPKWMPQQGLAVIPHKLPPHMPSREEIEGIDPRLMGQHGMGSALDVPEFVFGITEETGKEDCCKTMLGHAALSLFLTKLKVKDLHQKWKDLFGSRVTDRHFRSLPLFIPLFGALSFQNAAEDDLSSWLEFFELYIGESKEDQGIVIAAKQNIDSMIEDLIRKIPTPIAEAKPEVLRW